MDKGGIHQEAGLTVLGQELFDNHNLPSLDAIPFSVNFNNPPAQFLTCLEVNE